MTVAFPNSSELPELVRTADGSYYEIPDAGPWGSFSWARQASLVRNAYEDVGNDGEAENWRLEWDRRVKIWDSIERGADTVAIVQQFGADLLSAPFRILKDVGDTAIDIGKQTTGAVFNLAKALPWLILAALIVVGIGFNKKQLSFKG